MITEGKGHEFLHLYVPSVMQTHTHARKGRKSNNLPRKEETFNHVTVYKGRLVQNGKKKKKLNTLERLEQNLWVYMHFHSEV